MTVGVCTDAIVKFGDVFAMEKSAAAGMPTKRTKADETERVRFRARFSSVKNEAKKAVSSLSFGLARCTGGVLGRAKTAWKRRTEFAIERERVSDNLTDTPCGIYRNFSRSEVSEPAQP